MFSRDYTLFFDIKEAPPAEVRRVYQEFTTHLAKLLTTLGVNNARAQTIADDLWNRMAQTGRHYHSPIHVLAMFAHAQITELPLNNTLSLAIWFHDAIIHTDPNLATHNEDDTADWMIQTLSPEGVDPNLLRDAADAIRSTARHLSLDIPAAHHPLMDLDLSGLSSTPQSFAQQSEAVRKESPHTPEEDYNREKLFFFSKLLERPSIYRTSYFESFEAVARRQLQREIQRLGGEGAA